MSNDFEILSRFLDRYGDDVEGRELDEIPDHIKPKLRDFAYGTLSETERRDLAKLLKEHSAWVRFLAGEARTLRDGGLSQP